MVPLSRSQSPLLQNVRLRRRHGRTPLRRIPRRRPGVVLLRLGRGMQYSAHARVLVVFVSQDDGGVFGGGDDGAEGQPRSLLDYVVTPIFNIVSEVSICWCKVV